jgi:hypothetical protein
MKGRCPINPHADSLRKRIFKLRKKLANLEDKRTKIKAQQENSLWQEFLELSVELDQAEQALIKINHETVVEINHLRTQITGALDEYTHWRKLMRETEISFMANIVRPGFILKQAIRQKAYLEKEYIRIRTGITEGDYESVQALERDIQHVLTHGEHAYDADERSFQDEQSQEMNLVQIARAMDGQTQLADDNEEQIIQSFKRIVLPAIHPDTSETNQETFLTVFEAYTSEDFLLMEAYVAHYRGDFEVDDQSDPIKDQDTLSTYEADYHRLAGRLNRKLQSLQKELTKEELEDPEKLQKNLVQQREELRRLIKDETQIIFELRKKIERLIQFYLDVNRSEANGA